MIRIKVGDFKLGAKERKVINDVLDSGRLSEGPKVRQFEEQWAKYTGTKYCVLVNSGTSALIAALYTLKKLFNIEDKAKVITSPLTFIATINAIVAAGLDPVFADINRETFVIDPVNIEHIIKQEKNSAIILPVHLMGYPADMAKINDLAEKYNLLVMEDASQAHGSIYNNKKTGSLSLLGCFSFYIAHNIQVGEMGAIVTNDDKVYKHLKKMKAHGRVCDCFVCKRAESKCPRISSYADNDNNETDFDPRFYHDTFGLNLKTMEFQAALGIVQLKEIRNILEKRSSNVRYLNKGLAHFKKILQLPVYKDHISFLAYPIIINLPQLISRKILRQKLESSGVETRPLFGCIPMHQPAYAHLTDQYKDKLLNAEYIGENGFYIGCHQYLKKKDLDFIISVFNKILKPII